MNTPVNVSEAAASILRRKKRQYPAHVNRISALDSPCNRRLYYMRHDWGKAAPVPDSLQGLFETGNELEPIIEKIVAEVGRAAQPRWRIVGSQTPARDDLFREYQISGTIDGLLQIDVDGRWQALGVIDVKTCNPNIYQVLTSYDSLSRYPHTRKWRGQVMLYSLSHNLDRCFILLVNKTNLYDMRLLDFEVDMAYCDRLLEKAKQVNEAVETETPPEKINDPDECPRCPFVAYCKPEYQTGGNLQMIDNDELAAVLDKIDQMADAKARIKELEKVRDAMLTKGQDVIVGNWMVQWKKVLQNKKAQPAHTVEQWRKKFVRLED